MLHNCDSMLLSDEHFGSLSPAYRMNLYVLYGSQDKWALTSYTVVNDWGFITIMGCVYFTVGYK